MTRPGFRIRVRSTTSPRRLRVEHLEDRSVPSFTAATSVPVGAGGSNPVAVAIGDFNEDGKLDAVAANQAATKVHVLLGNENGGFQAPSDIDVGATPYDVAVAHLNADGHLDLVTANRTTHTVSVLLGNGDGTFQAPVPFSTGASTSPIAVDVGDLNGDGALDLVTANATSSSVSVLMGDGTGQFGTATSVDVGGSPGTLVLADFTGDDRPDLATTRGFSAIINLNNGTGTFGAPVTVGISGSSSGLATGDFNHDGDADLVAAHPFATGGGVSVLLGNGNGTFEPVVRYDAGLQTPAAIVAADMDGDGNAELVTANDQFGNNSVSVLPGRADGTFGPARVYHAGLGPVSVAVGDFTGDGAVDVVTADTNFDIFAPGTVSLLPGNGDGSLKVLEAVVVSRPGAHVAADFTGDGNIDLAVVTWEVGYNGVTLFPGLGTGKFDAGIRTTPISIVAGLTGGDFNEDTKLDLAVSGSSGVTIMLGNGDGTFTAAGPALPAGSLLSWMISADLDNDTHADLAVGNSAGVSVLLGNGDGTFDAAAAVTAGGNVSYLAAADLDDDTDTDLIALNSAQASVLLGNGDGTFAAPTSFSVTGGPGSISIGDLDQDGDPDFVVPYHVGTSFAMFLNAGGGSFGPGPEVPVPPTGGRPLGSTVVDLDGDGAVEVVTVNNFADTVTVFKNIEGTFAVTETYVVGSRPEWVTAADFNGDGRLDLAVTNSIASTVSILSTPEAAVSYEMSVSVGSAIAGQTVDVTVSALDSNGNLDVDFRGSVSFASDDLQAILPEPYQFTAADGGTRTFQVTLKTAGTREVTVTGDLGSTAANVAVSAADADHMTFTVPTDSTAGTAFDVTVTAFDPFGNVADGYRGTVSFQTTDPHAAVVVPADYQFTAGDAGTHTFTGVTLVTAGSRTVTVSSDTMPEQSGAVTVSAAAASKLTMSVATSTTAGIAQPVVVTAFDAFDNLATGFTGTVGFTTTDPIGDVPGNYTFVAADAGTHTFQATFKRAGTQTLTVDSTGLTGAQQTSIQVSPAGASKLGFERAPANTFRLTAMPGPVTVQVQDAFGNAVGGTFPVTLSFGANPTGARLRGMTAVTNAAGVATFPKLQLTKAGVGYTLVANAPNLTTAASDPITVYTATRLKVALSSTTQVAGAPITVTVTALDAKGKIDPTYRGTVHFTSTAFPHADLPDDYTFTAADNGTHTFPVSLNKAGLRRLLVVDAAKMGVRGRAAIRVSAGETAGFTLTGLPKNLTLKANVARAFVVTAVDAYGNRTTGYTGTVTFGGPGTVTSNRYDFGTRDRGRRVFRVTFPATGTGQSLTVVDPIASTIDGAVTGITVI